MTVRQLPIRIDQELYDDIRAEADRRGISMNLVIRERLAGQRTENVPMDTEMVKAMIRELLVNDPEVAEALKSKA